MPDIPGTSRAQTNFLRAFVKNPAGPSPESWPSPAILRRWLRKPRFRSALNSVQLSIRFQTDFHIASAATSAARNLDHPDNPASAKQLENILRIAHLRQRFNATAPEPEFKKPESHNDWLKKLPPARRLTEQEFHALALQRNYVPPLQKMPDFPDPTPQDTPYFQILHNPKALFWWMKIYEHKTGDQRYRKILQHCRDFVPNNTPWSGQHNPFFPNMPKIDPYDGDAQAHRKKLGLPES